VRDKKFLILVTLGCYLMFVALVISAVSGYSAWRLHVVRTQWQRLDAEVQGCSEKQIRRTRGGFQKYTQCSLQYWANGQSQVVTTLTRNSWSAPTQQWMGEHPPGSHMVLYYDAESGRVSLGGADAAIDTEEPQHFFRAAGCFAAAGMGLLAIAFWTRKPEANFQ
jgi:hypothetical protein